MDKFRKSDNQLLLDVDSFHEVSSPSYVTLPPDKDKIANEIVIANSKQQDQGCSSYLNDFNSPTPENISTESEGLSLKVYKKRWIILGIFCMMCVMQNIVWNTWGPIAITAENYFHWSNDDIAELVNWDNINVLIFILPCGWLLDTRGIRVTVVSSTFLLFLSAGLRCITFENPFALWLMNAGQFFSGISINVTLVAPSILSTLWFPLKERVTAVSIVSIAESLGTILSFLVGITVNDVGMTNSTDDHLSHVNASHQLNEMNSSDSVRERNGRDIRLIMYSEFGICTLIFISILCYFPNRPKLPPSKTASFESKVGLKEMMRNKNMWLICISSGITFGTIGNFISLIPIILKPLNVSQRQSQYIGIFGQLIAISVPVIVGKIADRISKSLKVILGFFWGTVAAASVILTLICLKFIADNIAVIYFLAIVINGFVSICYPLSWQLASEITYPASEGLTVGMMYFFQNFVGTVFLFLFKIPNIGIDWVMITSSSATVIGFLLFLFIKMDFRRFEIDSTAKCEPSNHYGSINA